MNNIRKIITERLENAGLDYRYWLSGIGSDGVIETDFYKIEGQIQAYQDCLNLIDEYTPKIVTKQLSVKEIETLLQDLNKPHQFIIDKPTPRTEQDILNDFEKLGYQIKQNNSFCLIMINDKTDEVISILKKDTFTISMGYRKYIKDEDYLATFITMQEHKLLNELFTLLGGWL